MRLATRGGLNLARMRWRMGLGKNEDWTFLADGSAVRSLRLPRAGETLASPDGRPRLARILPAAGPAGDPGSGDGQVVDGVRVEFDTDDRAERERLAATLAHCLSLEADLESFYAMAGADGILAPLAARYRGLRIVRDANLFESVVKTIVGQQVNLAFAGTLIRRLRSAAEERIPLPDAWRSAEGDPPDVSVFPSPERLATLDVDRLRELQFTRSKAAYVLGIARAVAAGELDLAELAAADDETFTARLTALKGVGRWTAECVLLFGLGRPDLLPAADIGLRNALRRALGRDDQPGEAEVRALGEAWRPHRSYATLYLWESLHDGISD